MPFQAWVTLGILAVTFALLIWDRLPAWLVFVGTLLVAVGGGIGRIMRLGFQPVNVSVQAYGNVKRPDNLPSPTWQLKFQIAFLYPKRPKA
jgi:hypothetical protein